MRVKKWVIGAALASFLGVAEAPAQQVEFKTMEMHSLAGPQEPVFVQVAHHRTRVARSHYVAPQPRYVVRKRSKGKSAAIVGGSAAGGALIGALAGGGKGAAIGAVAGGGAGYLYDRKTHNKTVRVQ